MRANAIQTYADKLIRQAKADPKKATILVVAGIGDGGGDPRGGWRISAR